MNTQLKKLFSLLTAIMMMVSYIPTSLAEGDGSDPIVEGSDVIVEQSGSKTNETGSNLDIEQSGDQTKDDGAGDSEAESEPRNLGDVEIVSLPKSMGLLATSVATLQQSGELSLTDITERMDVTVNGSNTVTDVSRSSTFNLNISYFVENSKLNDAKAADCWVYDLNDFVDQYPVLNLANTENGTIMEGRAIRGSYKIVDNKVYLYVDKDWLSKKTSDVQGSFNLSVQLDETQIKGETEHNFTFPGSSTPVKVEFTDVNVYHSKTVDNNTWNNIVTVEKNADGSYTMHYRLKVNSDSYLDKLTLSDTVSASQTLIRNSIKLIEGDNVYTNLALGGEGNTFTLDLIQTLKNNNTDFKKNTEYYVEYDVTIPAEKVGKVDGSGNPLEDSEQFDNTATWSYDGNKEVQDETSVHTKSKKIVTKDVTSAQNDDGKTVLTYTITLGDASTDFAGHTISDSMIMLQDLNTTSIVIKNSAGEAVKTLTPSWTKPSTYKNAEQEVFSYTFPQDDHTYGPLTITYTTVVNTTGEELDESVKGNLWVGNKVYDEYPEGEKPGASAGKTIDYGKDEDLAEAVTVNKSGQIATDKDKIINWTITVTPAENAALPLRNVKIKEYDYKYDFGTNAQNDYDRKKALQVQLDEIVVESENGNKLIKDTDYTISIEEWGEPPAIYIEIAEMTGPLTIMIPTYVPDGFENGNNDIFYAGNKVEVEIPGTKKVKDEDVVCYSNNEHSFSKTVSYDESNDLFEWTIVLNPTKNLIDPDYKPGFKDLLPEGMEFVSWLQGDSVTYEFDKQNILVEVNDGVLMPDGSWQWINDWNVAVNINGQTISTPTENGLLEPITVWGGKATVPIGLSQVKYTIKYKTKLTDDEKSRIRGTNDTYRYTNGAWETKNGEEIKYAEADADYTYRAVTKMDLSPETLTEDLIQYKIEANPEYLTLHDGEDITVWDFIETNVELVTNSVSVKITNSDGSDVTNSVSYQVGYNDDTRRLTVTIPDCHKAEITFQVRVKELTGAGNKASFSNKVVLEGNDRHEYTVSKQHSVVNHSATIKGASNTIELLKINEYNLTQTLEDAEFELYQLTIDDDKVITRETLVGTYTTNSEGKIIFTGVAYKTPYYWIETKAPDGFSLPTENRKHYFIVYGDMTDTGKTDAEKKAMRQEVWDLDDAMQKANNITVKSIEERDEWTATNKKDTSFTVPLSAKKSLLNKALEDGMFTFTVTPANSNDNTGVNMTGLKTSVTNKGEDVDFGVIKFTEEGTFVYTIKETVGTDGGINYDTTEYTVTVNITRDENGDLHGTVTKTRPAKEGEEGTSVSVSEMTFENEYTATGDITFEGTKTITGRKFKDGDSLTVTISSSDGGKLPSTARKTVTLQKGQTTADFAFEKVTYNLNDLGGAKAKVYHYTVTEIADMEGTTPVLVSDTVTVTLTDMGNGTIKVDKTFGNRGEKFTIENAYSATGSFAPHGTKNIQNRTFQIGDTLSVTISAADGVKLPDPATLTNIPLQAGTNTANYSFSSIQYTLDDLKGQDSATFTYTVTENAVMAGTTPDTKSHTITVKVTDNGDGSLEVEPVYSDGDGVAFVNTYNATGKFQPTGTKTLEGRNFKEGDELKVSIKADDGGRLPDPSDVTVELSTGSSTADFQFNEIEYQLSDLGGKDTKVFHYTVTETAKMDDTVADSQTHTITVTVTDQKNGNLKVEPDYSDEGNTVSFVNKATGSLSVSKTVTGNAADSTKEFGFTIELSGTPALTGEYGVISRKEGHSAETTLTFNNNIAQFSLIDGETATVTGIPKDFTYKVIETDYSAAGYSTTHTVNSGTVENGGTTTGTIVVNATQAVQVTNTRNATGGLKIQKNVTGNASSTMDEFKFKITLTVPDTLTDAEKASKYSDVQFDEDGSAIVTIKGNESKTIEGLPNGTTYTIEELGDDDNPLSVLEGAETTTAAKGYVTKDVIAEGKIQEAVIKEHVFTNTKESFADLEIGKIVTGYSGEADRQFTFNLELKDSNNKPITQQFNATKKNGTSSTSTKVSFSENGTVQIKLKDSETMQIHDLPNGAKYTVTEVSVDGYVTTIARTIRNGEEVSINNENAETGASDMETGDETGSSSEDETESEGSTGSASASVSGTVQGADNKVYVESFTNQKDTYGELKIRKKLTGNAVANNLNTPFPVKVTIYRDESRTEKAEEVNGSVETYGQVFTKGVSTFNTTADALVTLKHLPDKYYFEIEETGYTPTITKKGGKGDLTVNNNNNQIIGYGQIDAKNTGDDILLIEIENTVNEWGGLELSKILNSAAEEDLDKEFSITVYFYADAVETDGMKVMIDGTETSLDVTESAPDVFGAGADQTVKAYYYTANLKGGASATLNKIPAGTPYYIVEDAYANFITTYSGQSGTVVKTNEPYGPADSNKAAVTNTRKTGSLMVTKQVEGNQPITEENFAIQVDFGSALTEGKWQIQGSTGNPTPISTSSVQVNLKSGETVVFTGIPVGTTYTVKENLTNEQKPKYISDVAYISDTETTTTHTIVEDTTSEVMVTNTQYAYGGIQIKKVTDGNDPDKKSWFAVRIEISDTTFTDTVKAHDARGWFDIQFVNGVSKLLNTAVTNSDDAVPIEDAKYWLPNKTKWTAVPADEYIAIKAGAENTLTLIGLPAGATYTVTEESYSETYDSQTVTYGDTNQTIDALYYNTIPETSTIDLTNDTAKDKIDLVTVTNVRDRTGKLVITKIIQGNDISEADEFEFTITTDNPKLNGTYSGVKFVDGKATVTLTGKKISDEAGERGLQAFNVGNNGGVSITIEGLPLEMEFTVTESAKADGYELKGYDLLYRSKVADDTRPSPEQEAFYKYWKNKDWTSGEKISTHKENENSDKINVDQRIVVITNERNTWGKLKVSKKVGGNAADQGKSFHFEVTLYEDSNCKDPAAITGLYGAMYFKDGVAYASETATESGFDLKHDGFLLAENLPNGLYYKVVETDYSSDGYDEVSIVTTGAISEKNPREVTGRIYGGETESVEYTNIRNATGSMEIHKVLAGNDPETDYTFEFSLTSDPAITGEFDATIGTATSKVEFDAQGHASVRLQGNETIRIAGLPNGAKVTVKEIGTMPEKHSGTAYSPINATNDGAEVTISETATEPVKVTVTNTRNTTGKLTVSKEVQGVDADTTKLFTFNITFYEDEALKNIATTLEEKAYGAVYIKGGKVYASADAASGEPGIQLKDGGSIEISGLPNGLYYQVTEEIAAGYSIAVKNGQTGETSASGQITDEIDSKAEFVNTYSATPDDAQIYVKKVVSGKETWDNDDSYTFELRAIEGAPLPENTRVTVTKSESTKAFDKITYTAKGEYKYQVVEIPGNVYGVVYSTTPVEVTVSVTDNGEGKLTATVTSVGKDADNPVTITNTYGAKGSVTITGQKKIENRKFTAGDKLTVTIEANNGGRLPEVVSKEVTLTEDTDTASFDFGPINYVLEDLNKADTKTFTYTITETAEMKGTMPVVGEYTVSVTVVNNKNGSLTATANYGEGKAAAELVNRYNATGTVTLEGIKTLQNRNFEKNDTLSVKIAAEPANENIPLPAIKEKTVSLPTNTNTASFEFGPIEYKLSDLGDAKSKEFTYVITETANMQSTKTDPAAHKVVVTVADNDTGTLQTSVKYLKADEEEEKTNFLNTFDYVDVSGTKTWFAAGAIPERIIVTLYKTVNEQRSIVQSIEVKKKDTDIDEKVWSYSFTKLPKYEGTNEITYSVDEVPVVGFVRQVEDYNITNTEITVNIIKLDANDAPLSGATLQILDGNTVVDEWISDGNAHTTRQLISGRTYTIHEVKAPVGYKLAEDKTFVIGENGQIDFTLESVTAESYADAGNNGMKVVDAESSEPTFQKKIKDKNDTEGSETDWQDSADYDIGDEIPYQLKATLANNVTDYYKYHITFHDTMERGLTFKEITSVKVNEVEVAASDYVLNQSGQKFDLTLTWEGTRIGETEKYSHTIMDGTLNKGTVTVEFVATLNENAVVGSYGNVNTCYLEYSSNPAAEGDGVDGYTPSDDKKDTPDDSVIAFTYRVVINKVDKDGKALKGAAFRLEKNVKNGEGIEKKEIAPENTVTDDTTTFLYKGLDDGEYILTETKVPVGHKAIDPIKFKVTADHKVEWDVSTPGEVGSTRSGVLTSLTGEKQSGEITIQTNAGTIIGTVKNEEAEKPTFEKKIADVNDSTEEALKSDLSKIEIGKWKDSADYDIGDDVPYKLTATLADNVTDYYRYHITFHDTLEDGKLSYNNDARVEVIGADGNTIDASTYAVTETGNAGDNTFTVTLTWGTGATKINNANLNKATVNVYFTGKLLDGANLGKQGNINTAYLVYSNNPSVSDNGTPSDDTGETDKDSVIAFTYQVVINKVDDNGEALEGAAFTLEKKLKDGTAKTVSLDTTESTASTFNFKGLDDGEYVLTETKTPAGYKSIAPITFKVTADHEIEWTDLDKRADVLTKLSGDVTTGELTLAAKEDLSELAGSVKNTPAKPTFEKKIKDKNDSDGKESDWQDSADYDIGDKVPYKLTAVLADNVTDYYKYHITFNDTLEEGRLSYNDDAEVEVIGANGEKLTSGYVVEKTGTAGDNNFTVTLTWGNGSTKIDNVNLNKATVNVYFTGTLLEGAKLGTEGNVNTAYLEYSNNPSVEDDSQGGKKPSEDVGTTDEDSVIVFTYLVDINKVDESGEALSGAEFTLEKKLAGGGRETITTVKSEDGTSFSFKGLDDGDYILTETKVPDGYKSIKPIEFSVVAEHKDVWDVNNSDGVSKTRKSVLTSLTGKTESGAIDLSSDKDAGSVTGKVENTPPTPPTFEKKIMDTNDSTGVTSGWQDSADYDIGDAVPYRLSATLADNVSDYYRYHITFHDTMEESLDFNAGSVTVKIGNGAATPISAGEGTVSGATYKLAAGADGHSFDLTLTWEGAKSDGKYTGKIAESLNSANVVVNFTAKLNEKANIGKHGNVNAAYLEYSCNPKSVQGGSGSGDDTPGDDTETPDGGTPSDETENTPKDAVIVFTYETIINKVDETGKALKGAEFKMEKVDKDGKVIATLTKYEKDSNETTFAFRGLDDGIYRLTETKAPAGYSTLAKPILITVEAGHATTWTVAEAIGTTFEALPGRDGVLTKLTGDTDSGELKLEYTKQETLEGKVTNKPETGSMEIRKVFSIREAQVTVTPRPTRTPEATPTPTPGPETSEEPAATPEPTETPTLTATPVIPRTSLSVRKVWDDDHNEAGRRPASVTMTLSNGQSVTLSVANGWQATIADLPLIDENGIPIQYYWTEKEIAGYEQTAVTVVGNGVTIFTNSLIERGQEPPEDRVPPKNRRGENLEYIDDYGTPLGVDIPINHVGDCFD